MSKQRNTLSLAEKQKILEAAEKNCNKSDLARQLSKELGKKIPRSTIVTVLKDKRKIQGAIDSGSNLKRTRISSAKHEDLEKAVFAWYKTVMSHPDAIVTGNLLIEKAKALAVLLKIEDFQGSAGWLDKFKKRHSITFGKRKPISKLAIHQSCN